ncbi:MAG: Fe-S-containing protein [Thermoanaerobaculia bacterium]|nr:Fe-S-containing protein [Thermoanaerobaculia bacterium]
MKLTPKVGILAVLGFLGIFLGIELAMDVWFGQASLELVKPDQQGVVRIDLRDFEPLDVRFYRFLNAGNQEVEFLVGRDENGVVQVGFNTSENHSKTRRGFSAQGEWVIDNKCETTTRLSEVNQSSGLCRPIPLAHEVHGDELILREPDLLAGWRYFR